MKAVVETIRRHRKFLITSHVNPDWDGIGAGLALASLLKRLGKQVVLAYEGGMPEVFDFLPRVAPMRSGSNGSISAEVAMVVDVPTFARIGKMGVLLKKTPLTVNIDHHVSNQRFGDVNWVDKDAAAVGQMIYLLYRAFRFKPTPEEARCLYVSLVTDTGSFRYMNTTPAVHRIAADLVGAGASPLKVSQRLYEAYSLADLKFLGWVLSSIRSTPDKKVAWLEVPLGLLKKFGAGASVVDELVNYPRSVKTAEVAFVLRPSEDGKNVRVSLRSKGMVDVDQIARAFGGGGHVAASGCVIPGTLSQAREKMLKVVRQFLRRSS